MKKHFLLALIVGVTVLGIAAVLSNFFTRNPGNGFNLGGGNTFSVEPIWFNNYSTTTTLPRTAGYASSYLTTGAASSTFQFPCEGADQIDLNLMTIASSTASKIQWEYAFSDDYALWFYEDGRVVDSSVSVTHGANPVQHYWTPATTATSTKNLTITPVASRYCKIFISSSGANAGIWAEVLLKKAF